MCSRIVCRDQFHSVIALAALVVMSIVLIAVMPTGAAAEDQIDSGEDTTGPQTSPKNALPQFNCGYRAPVDWLHDLQEAVARGEIDDPARRPIPVIAPGRARTALLGGPPCLSPAHIFPFEDTDQLLLTNFSSGQLINLMVTAANDLLAAHGDNYDFVGYWVNFTPHHTIGTAFYKYIENDVMGIGDPSTMGTPIFNLRPSLGLGGENLEGFVMMWNVNSNFWQPGDSSGADFTRLVLGQEFEHRYAMFLPQLLDGRILQGDNGSCGRAFHWNWQVDGQGSAMDISEWVGSNPANLQTNGISFNTDTGGVFSYTDLYLMGYITPQEMDAGNSELRFMDESNCSPVYPGPISTFSSADIIASAGPRIPDSSAEDQHYRTAWIMIHQPGDPPSEFELTKLVGILEQHMLDWQFGTLGRGTMDNSLFPDCNCNGVPDSDDIAKGDSDDQNDNGIPDECECLWDLNDDGSVGVADLLALLAAWGTDPGGPPDFDGDGNVGVSDLLALLANWGPCS